MKNKRAYRNNLKTFKDIWHTHIGKIILISGFVLLYLFACGLGGVFYYHHKCNQLNEQLNAEKVKLTNTTQQKNAEIEALKETKPMRSFQALKSATDNALNGVLGAMYNWDGSNFADRYEKALQYMDKDVLIKAFAPNGSIPSKKSMQQTAKDYSKNDAVDKLTVMQNGIQNIDGNDVKGFVWATSQFSEFGKNTTVTMQAQYTYNVKKQKFTDFKLEPFSSEVVD